MRRQKQNTNTQVRQHLAAPDASGLALAGFELPLGLVDDVDATTAAHQAVCAVPRQKRFQRVFDFHFLNQLLLLVGAKCNGKRFPGGQPPRARWPGKRPTRIGKRRAKLGGSLSAVN